MTQLEQIIADAWENRANVNTSTAVAELCQAVDRQTLAAHSADVWHALNAAYAWVANERPDGVVSVYGNDFLRP